MRANHDLSTKPQPPAEGADSCATPCGATVPDRETELAEPPSGGDCPSDGGLGDVHAARRQAVQRFLVRDGASSKDTFEVGALLAGIRDEVKAAHKGRRAGGSSTSFKRYCTDVLGISKTKAYALIGAFEVMRDHPVPEGQDPHDYTAIAMLKRAANAVAERGATFDVDGLRNAVYASELGQDDLKKMLASSGGTGTDTSRKPRDGQDNGSALSTDVARGAVVGGGNDQSPFVVSLDLEHQPRKEAWDGYVQHLVDMGLGDDDNTVVFKAVQWFAEHFDLCDDLDHAQVEGEAPAYVATELPPVLQGLGDREADASAANDLDEATSVSDDGGAA